MNSGCLRVRDGGPGGVTLDSYARTAKHWLQQGKPVDWIVHRLWRWLERKPAPVVVERWVRWLAGNVSDDL